MSLPEARPSGTSSSIRDKRSIRDRASDFGSDGSQLVSIPGQLTEFLLTLSGCVQASQPHSLLSGVPLGSQAYRSELKCLQALGDRGNAHSTKPIEADPTPLWLNSWNGLFSWAFSLQASYSVYRMTSLQGCDGDQ